MRPADQVTAFDGQHVYSRAQLSHLIEAAAGRLAKLVFLREGIELRAQVESQYSEEFDRQLIGIQFNILGDLDYGSRAHPTPWTQVKSHAGPNIGFCTRRMHSAYAEIPL